VPAAAAFAQSTLPLYFTCRVAFQSGASGSQIMKMRYGHSVMIDMSSELAVVLHEFA